MPARLAILCPGQGGQHAAMFDAIRNHPRDVEVFEQLKLDARFDIPLDTILRDSELLFANRYAQPLVVAASLAAWLAIREGIPEPALVTGYSIGELTAYGVAGALVPTDVMRLASLRAETMDGASASSPDQGLMSVSGIPIATLQEQLRGLDAWIAIETGFDTAIVGGRTVVLQSLQQAAQVAGAKAGMLPVGIASHTPLMKEAVLPFAQALAASDLHDPSIPVLAGISGQPVQHRDAAIGALQQQMTNTIRWKACMDACSEQGATVALELGPGSALSRMLREHHPHIECRSLADFRSLEGATRWVESRMG